MSAWLDEQRVRAAANNDGEFLLQARLWNATVALTQGADTILLTVAQGRIATASSSSAATPDSAAQNLVGAPPDVHISAPPADWDELLRPIPRPFYQDVRAAAVHHGFLVAGELAHTAAYYPAIRRLIELLREVRNGTL